MPLTPGSTFPVTGVASPTIPPSAPSSALPPLPSTFPSTTPPTLIAHGAEALLYRTTYLTPHIPCALKHRPPKPYRHPTLDARLTRHRVLSEARLLIKCRREGVPVPGVYFVDPETGVLGVEWVKGSSVKDVVRQAGVDWEGIRGLCGGVGNVVGRLHACGVVHGDLTTSNLLVRPRAKNRVDTAVGWQEEAGVDGEVVLIDFGLGQVSVQDEDRAVDLYVLERAFGSTHPKAEAEGLFEEVLRAYGESYKGARVVLKRLEDVRMRGRKKNMVG